MNKVTKVSLSSLAVLFTALMVLGGVACGGSPTAPIEGFDGAQGATLTGRFVGSGTAQTLGAFALTVDDHLTVVVYSEGREIGRVDVINGAFTLRGLPESFTLEFVDESGQTVGKFGPFEGVKPNQEIDIVLDIVGETVVLLEERRTGIDHEGSIGIELNGTARYIEIDSPEDPMTGSLEVNRYTVLTRAAETSIRKGNRSLTLEDLDGDDQVHVRGVFEGANVFAYEIKLQEEEENTKKSPPNSCNKFDPNKPGHILICHNGRTISVAQDAWPDHAAHGDSCGECK